MAAPVPTWTGAPVVTFPQGCSDPDLIHIEFDAPTYDRDPGHIPVDIGTLGPTFGFCIETGLENFERIGGSLEDIEAGTMPTSRTGLRWFGAGAETFDLYIDGIFVRSLGSFADGASVSIDLATALFGYAPPDWSAPHTFMIRISYEDIPSWKTWGGYIFQPVCYPVLGVGTPSPVYPWAMEREALWPAGFDPGGGLTWGPFGADVPNFAITHTVQYFVPWALPGEIITDAITYEFDGPIATTSCSFAGFYDPAAGATVTDNAPPGIGGDPTATDGVTLSTLWSCRDEQSFLFTGADLGTATSPYDTAIGAAEPAYLELTPAGGSQDVWYYQSALLYLPPGFLRLEPAGDSWLIMGIRSVAASGPDTWKDNIIGLALVQTNLGALSIHSFLGSANVPVTGDPLIHGTPIPISGSGPHCLQLAVKRESDESGSRDFVYWTFQVDDSPVQSISTRAIYSRPDYALWGILDNIGHANPNPSLFFMDDLHFDIAPYGCRCRNVPNAVFATPHPFRADH